jgi:hypothetical protein
VGVSDCRHSWRRYDHQVLDRMTPQEHEILALKMKSLAQQTLIDWIADMWRSSLSSSSPQARALTVAATAQKLQEASAEYSGIALPWLDPATSDMQSALFQEAFQECANSLVARLTSLSA